MSRSFLTVGLAAVITVSCSEAESPPAKVSSVSGLGDCVATGDDLYELRKTFKDTARDIARGIQVQNEPLKLPFADPPSVRHTTNLNPSSTEYGWTIRLAKGCVYSEAREGFRLDEVEFSAKLNETGKIETENMHLKISDK
jgi:hypothetical protein